MAVLLTAGWWDSLDLCVLCCEMKLTDRLLHAPAISGILPSFSFSRHSSDSDALVCNKKLFSSARLTTIADNVVIGGVGDIVMAPIRDRGMMMLGTHLELQSVHAVASVPFAVIMTRPTVYLSSSLRSGSSSSSTGFP